MASLFRSLHPKNPTNFQVTDIPSQEGKTVVVTGGNTGIGYETVLHLAKNGAHVYLAARSLQRATEAIEKIKKQIPNAKIDFLQLDLQDLNQVDKAASEFLSKEKSLDILINNAGIMAPPFQLTKDGIESQFATNHVGHFHFTTKIISLLQKAPAPRVVNLSSIAHELCPPVGIDFENINNEKTYSSFTAYGQSKLANILFTLELNKRYPGIISNSVHPGWVHTELSRNLGLIGTILNGFNKLFALTPLQGAITSLYAATAPIIEKDQIRNNYFVPLADSTDCIPLGKDEGLAARLWEFTEKLVAEKLE